MHVQDFREEEIKCAVWDCEGVKILSSDEFKFNFIKKIGL